MAKKTHIVSLHKYWIWANKFKSCFEYSLKSLSHKKARQITLTEDWVIFMSYWYSALYVVIEGWKQLKLTDAKINVMLRSRDIGFLKKYRHGVVHFQSNYFSERFDDFISSRKGKSALWIRMLHDEFGRFFLEWHKQQKS